MWPSHNSFWIEQKQEFPKNKVTTNHLCNKKFKIKMTIKEIYMNVSPAC